MVSEAKELLAESFTELAEHKPIDKITIREITDNCGYSPATFYRQFKDKYDLVAWDYTRGHSEIMNRLLHKDYEWRKTLLDGAYHFYERREHLAAFPVDCLTSSRGSYSIRVIRPCSI